MTALREFVADLLESEGAMVEPVEPDGLDVMAPDGLRAAYGWPELARLGFGAAPQPGSIPIGLEDDWLDRLGALLGHRGRITERQMPIPDGATAPNDPRRLIDNALTLPNAVWRLNAVAPAWSRCLLLAFRYCAVSDEKRDGLVWLGFNCTTGAVLDEALIAGLQRSLSGGEDWLPPTDEARRSAGPSWAAPVIADRSGPLLDRRVRADLAPFLGAMRRRLDRDSQRVHAYHDDLRTTALRKLASLESPVTGKGGAGQAEKIEAAIKRERHRVATIEREYGTKLGDLRHNYALSVKVEWVQALVLIAPVQRHTLLIKRRKSERTIAMDWHMGARRMEFGLCDWGDGLSRERLACDDQLHLTAEAGQAPCAACGKLFCRACHPARCPRCRKPCPPT